MSQFQFVRPGIRDVLATARAGRSSFRRFHASPGDQVSLVEPALRVRKAVRGQVLAVSLTSILAAMLAVLAVMLPEIERLLANVCLLLVVISGGLVVGMLDLGISRSLSKMVQSGAHYRQSAAERAAELARLNVMLRRRDRERALLFATMSHELRTPLNAIIGYSRLLLDNLDGVLNDEQRTDVAQIYQGGTNLLRIVNGTLDLARLDAGNLHCDLAPVQTWAVAEEVVALLRPLAEEKGLALTSTISPALPAILANEERLRQVLVNLVGNAVKFTDSGTVTLRAGQTDRHVSLTVQDTGPGIEASYQERIFEPFRQAQDGTNKPHEGTGLGLAIARRLVHLMGGAIHLESEPGSGSEFTVTFPLAEYSPLDADADTAADADGSVDVLIVAAAGRAETLAPVLAEQGLSVQLSDPAEWQRVIRHSRPQTMLVDARLPQAGAWRVLQELSASELRDSIMRAGLFSAATGGPSGADHGAAAGGGWNVVLTPHLRVLNMANLDTELTPYLRRVAAESHAPVLLVGADGGWRRQTSMEVQRAGLGVHEVADGESALSAARRMPCSAIIVDVLIGSPGIVELLAELQAAVGRRACPVLIVLPSSLSPCDQRDLQLAAASWLAADVRSVDEAAAIIAATDRAVTRESVPVGRR
ncbi:MAG: ATP-binding protein [Chloroflexota bacterium]